MTDSTKKLMLQPTPDIESSIIELSIIVPAYNEEEVLPIFHEKILEVLKPLNISYEIVYINDGSRDKTESIILELQKSTLKLPMQNLAETLVKKRQ